MEDPPGPRQFATTHWSLVSAAKTDEASQTRAREALNDRLQLVETPEFLDHDAVIVRYWDMLVERFPDYQFLLVENATGGWTNWTGTEFPGDGPFIVPGALVPISVAHHADQACFIEPGIWVLHKTVPRQSS